MAPAEASEDPNTNKRKRETDEHGKRKRTRRNHRSSKGARANGQPSQETPTGKVNGANGSTIQPGDIDGANNINAETDNTSITKKEKQQLDVKTKQHDQPSEDQLSTWKVSKPMGGRMLNIDPILTQDEKYLIIAYNTSIQVYSAEESLLVRKIPLLQLEGGTARKQVVSICLSPSSPNIVWVASAAGHIWSIDWTNGDGAGTANRIKGGILSGMSVESMKINRILRDVPFVSIDQSRSWRIIACDFQGSKLQSSKEVFSQAAPIFHLRSVRNGYALVASSRRDILFGIKSDTVLRTFNDLKYEFFTLNGGDEITCLDVRVTDRVHLTQKSLEEAGNSPIVEIVVGCARGAIFFYNDLVLQLSWLHTPKGRGSSLHPRKYHWHRKAVHAVKWSRDGNYIISGGSESTLVLWQLDTHKMDFLPHLSATVENIVVSDHGSSYVVHLDDNSVIVLSTAEMKPTTYISGIQTLIFPRPLSKDDIVKRVEGHTQNSLIKTPAAINPADPSRVHFCVGNGQQISHSPSGPSIPLIQTIDLTTLQGISKRPLTRTNPTDNNITSEGYTITEPRVTDIVYSADGKWLATTDEWQPPTRDVDSLDGSPTDRREVYLKFWAVSSEDQSLELVSRINAPHYTGRSEPIYGLAADPSAHRFASIGEDGIVRLWEPVVRQRDGVLVKGKMERQLYSWTCSQTIYLQENEDLINTDATTTRAFLHSSGAVAFSEDGSTLVCAIQTVHGAMVHVIDTESGKIRNSIDGLIAGEIRDVKILSSTLVLLSDRLMVYDLVSDELLYGVKLRMRDAHGGPGASILPHLAVNYRTSTFAVAVSQSKLESRHNNSELAIFTPDQCEPEIIHQFPHPIISVVAVPGSSEYLILDSAAQLWSVSESMDTKSLAFAQPLVDLNLDRVHTHELPEEGTTLALLPGDDDEPASGDEMDVDIPDDTGDDVYPAVIAPQRLTELFDTAPAFAMPPIEDMFYQVTKLFSSKSAVAV